MVLGVNELLIISAAPFNGLTTKLDTPDEANFPKADADADDRSNTAEARSPTTEEVLEDTGSVSISL